MLLRVPEAVNISDAELLRRYQILYPKPTQYQTASIALMAQELAAGGEAAEAIHQRLLVRMGDISQYMKALKQRKRPTGVLLYIEKIHAILAVWNQSTLKFV